MKVTCCDITPELKAIIAKAKKLTKGTCLEPKDLLKLAAIKLEREEK